MREKVDKDVLGHGWTEECALEAQGKERNVAVLGHEWAHCAVARNFTVGVKEADHKQSGEKNE